MRLPKVSVILPVYNCEHYLAQAIESVLSQTYQSFELLIIDDGSSDRSPDIIRDYTARFPEKVKSFQHPECKNHGVSASRNLGVRHAVGEYVAFLDSDDLWLPEKLQRQTEILDKYQDIGLVYCPLLFIDEHGQPLHNVRVQEIRPGKHSGTTSNAFDDFFSRAESFGFSVVFVRKDILFEIGLFDLNLDYQYEDAILVTKIAYRYPIFFLAEPLAHYRVHSNNASWHAVEQRGGKYINHAIMRRVQQWLKHTSDEYQEPRFRVKLAQLAQIAYHQKRISRWGFYHLLFLLFPYRTANFSLVKMFLTFFWGYHVTHSIQRCLNTLKLTINRKK